MIRKILHLARRNARVVAVLAMAGAVGIYLLSQHTDSSVSNVAQAVDPHQSPAQSASQARALAGKEPVALLEKCLDLAQQSGKSASEANPLLDENVTRETESEDESHA